MEKTMARAIYKKMEIGKWYTTSELHKLLKEAEYYSYIPESLYGKDVRKVVSSQMWNVVKAGFAKTEMHTETYYIVRGLRYNVKNRDWSKVPTQEYNVRYWMRTK